MHVCVVIFIIIAGLTQAKGSNFTYGGWAPFGVRGVWNGASLVFFSYIGFDAIATTAEEVLPSPSNAWLCSAPVVRLIRQVGVWLFCSRAA